MAGKQQGGEQGDQTLFYTGFAAVAFLLFVYFFGTQVKWLYLSYKLIQMKLITLVLPIGSFNELIDFIETTHPKDANYKQVLFIGNKVGWFINIPIIGGIAYWAYKKYNDNPMAKYKRVMNMKSLKKSEQELWPYIAPVVDTDLINEPLDKGPYAMCPTPYEFAIKHNLLTNPKDITSLDRKRTERLFVSQLGKPFNGVDKLRRHEKALLAIFVAHALGDSKGAMKAVNEIAMSAAQKNLKTMPDFSSTKPLFKHFENEDFKKLSEKHAYFYPLIARILDWSRTKNGVMPSSYFVWLKPRDRTLWYTLNCVGRQAVYVEAAAIYGHLRAELVAKHKIDTPYVTKAVDALEQGLREIKLEEE